MSTALQQSRASLPVRSNAASASSPTAEKRKRDVGPKFYAVKVGSRPGIYHSWSECLEQVKGVKGATFKSFPTLTEAEYFMKNGLSKDTSKFYGIRNGRVPGVYTDWDSARLQIVGWTKPKYKGFTTRAEAEAFVRDGVAANGVNGANTKDEDAQEEDSPAGTTRSKGPPAKKQKKIASTVTSIEAEFDEIPEPGTGPLPPGAEDGFDARILLDPETGDLNYKTELQRNMTKMQAIGLADGGMLRIYTDGSTLGNGGADAVAGVGVYFGPQDPRNISERLAGPRQTNQRAELTAIQRALEIAPRDRSVTIFSDSDYAIKCVTVWFRNWRDNGWKNSTKEDVKNRDLIETIVSRIDERKRLGIMTNFEWIKGHANIAGNVAADHLAVNGARMAQEEGL